MKIKSSQFTARYEQTISPDSRAKILPPNKVHTIYSVFLQIFVEKMNGISMHQTLFFTSPTHAKIGIGEMAPD